MLKSNCVLALSALLLALPTSAESKDEVSFKGKTLTLIIASDEGGGTDRVGRLFAQFLDKYLPGKPQIVIRNMGAGGGKVRAANYLMNDARPDGTTFMQSDSTGVSPSAVMRKSAKYDPAKFQYVGSMNRGGSILFIRKDAVAKMRSKSGTPAIVGAISGTRSWQAMPMWGAEFLGWNLRWLPGYKGTSSLNKALRQGEIDMFATNNAYVISELRKEDLIELIAQDGNLEDGKYVGRPSFKAVPTMHELLRKANIPKVAWDGFNVLTGPSNIDKWMGLPPNTPAPIVAAFRAAYTKAFNDPEFKKIAAKQFSAEVTMIKGDVVSQMVKEIHSASEEAVGYGLKLRIKYGLAAQSLVKKK